MVEMNITGRVDAVNQASIAAEPRPTASSRRAQSAPERPEQGTAEATRPEASLKEAAQGIERSLKVIGAQLRLEVDRDTGGVVVKVIDPATDEVIKQIPSKELIEIRKRIAEMLEGYSKRPEAVSIFHSAKVGE